MQEKMWSFKKKTQLIDVFSFGISRTLQSLLYSPADPFVLQAGRRGKCICFYLGGCRECAFEELLLFLLHRKVTHKCC